MWLLVRSFDGNRECIVADQAAVAYEVRVVDVLVEVSEYVEPDVAIFILLVPSVDGLVHWNGDPADATLITYLMAVMEADEIGVEHIKIGKIPRSNHELHPRIILESVTQMVIHERLQRMILFGVNPYLLSCTGVVAAVTRNDKFFNAGVFENELYPACQLVLHVDNGFHRA